MMQENHIPEISAPGTSLVVQWLRLRAPSAGAWVQPLVGELGPTCLKGNVKLSQQDFLNFYCVIYAINYFAFYFVF